MAITITTQQQVICRVAATAPIGTVPAAQPVTWAISDATKIGLASIQGDGNAMLIIGLGVGNGVTATATDADSNDVVFTFNVVAPTETALVGSNDFPENQYDPGRNRGRGLGLGYS